MTARLRGPAVSTSERVAALLRFDDIFDIGERIPDQIGCGRPRMFPGFMYVLYAALLSVYTSSRKVETELACESTWDFICAQVRERFPSDPSMWLNPDRPMRRFHYSVCLERKVMTM